MSVFHLCDLVRETGFSIHRFLQNGHLEKVYQRALAHRLTKQGIEVKQQAPLSVADEDGTLLGEYFADLFLEGRLIVEVKAVRHLLDEHTAQISGYLRASQIEHGLLINFGSPKFEIRKLVLSNPAPSASAAFQ